MYLDRINIILVCLMLLNFLPWIFLSGEEDRERPEILQGKIVSMEKEFQDFEELASWTDGARSALDPPPEEDVTTFVNRFQGLARAWKFNLQETSQTGENPVLISFTGAGEYKALANLTNEMTKSKAVVPKKILLAVQDNKLLNAHLELSVRFGPWQGDPVKRRNEPLPEPQPPPVLGSVDLFGGKPPPNVVTVQEPSIQYLGYSSGEGNPSGILTENAASMVIAEGEKTPGGLEIIALTPDYLEIRDSGGKTWKVQLKK